MDQPPTHYQVSFTARQAVLLFVLLLLALGIAYSFGLMTGLAGQPREAVAASGPAPPASTPRHETVVTALARAAVPTALGMRGDSMPAMASAQPTAPATLQLFEDGGESAATPAPRQSAQAPTPAPAEFWVQVVSVASEREARARSAKLRAHRYRTVIVPGPGRKGTIYRVRVGPYGSREEAVRAAATLRSREKVRPWIVLANP